MSHIGHTCVNNAVRIWLPTIIKVLSAWYSTRDKKHPVPERYYTEDNCPSSAAHLRVWVALSASGTLLGDVSHVVGTQCYVRPTCPIW